MPAPGSWSNSAVFKLLCKYTTIGIGKIAISIKVKIVSSEVRFLGLQKLNFN